MGGTRTMSASRHNSNSIKATAGAGVSCKDTLKGDRCRPSRFQETPNFYPPSMFNNASNIDASHSAFSEVHRDQYNTISAVVQGNQTTHTIVHGNQIIHGVSSSLDTLHKATATSAAFDAAQRFPAPVCLPGTRVEILSRISDWLEETGDAHPICWLSGLAGSGKSAIAQSVAEKYAAQNRLAASFFFSRREMERSTTHHFFPTITSHIMTFVPSMKPAVVSALDEDFTLPTKILREQMLKLLLAPLRTLKTQFPSPVLIVVDSLDECDNERLVSEVISLIPQLIRGCPFPLRVLMTSRAEPYLRATFREPDLSVITYLLELHTFDAQEDIRLFLRNSFAVIHSQRQQIMCDVPSPWPSESELEILLKKASGLFIYATTAVNFVGSRRHDPLKQLRFVLANVEDSAFADLDSLYHDAISIPPDHDLTRLILGIIRYASSPLSIIGLTSLLRKLDVDPRLVIPDLSSVLLLSEDPHQPVRIYHASFRDFLSNPQRSKKYFVDGAIYHRLIAELCLELMLNHLKRDVCDLGEPYKLNSEVVDLSERCERSMGEAVRYACRYWAHHLSRVPHESRLNEPLIATLRTFTRSTTLLYWLEALSLLGTFSNVVAMLRDTIQWLRELPEPPADDMDVLSDAERLVLMFFDPISQSALHIYHTALPFTPQSTTLRKLSQRDSTEAIQVRIGLEDKWDACTRTISVGSSVSSVAFSADGRLIASASDEEGVQLWDAVIGTNIANFGPRHKTSCAVRFSLSGSYVAIACENGLVAVWEVLTAQVLIDNDECHNQPVTCLAFSDNGELLASASNDTHIQLWSVTAGRTMHRLDLHRGAVRSVVFSSDNRLLVSGSDDSTIIMWDVDSGHLVRKLEGHSASVTCVVLSKDNMLIASGSDDNSVRTWDVATGMCVCAYSKNHKKGIKSVRFTSDGKNVISICDEVIGYSKTSKRKSFQRIWSAFQFYLKATTRTLMLSTKSAPFVHSRFLEYVTATEGYSDPPTHFGFAERSPSFAFSYGSLIFYAPSLASSSSLLPAFHSFSHDATTVAVSPDGARICSGNAEGTLQIWDPALAMKSWNQLSTDLKTTMTSLTASPDGKFYLVKSLFELLLIDERGTTLKALDVGDIDMQRNEDTCGVFSPDSNAFVYWVSDFLSSPPSHSLRVHSSVTGRRIARFPGLNWIRCATFSANGALVACSHGSGLVSIWDVASGRNIYTITTGSSYVSCIAFSRDTSAIVCGTFDGAVQLWDVQTGQLRTELEGRDCEVTSIIFSPEYFHVVIGHTDGSIDLWSPSSPAATSHELTSDNCAPYDVEFLAFSRDGATVTCRSSDGSVSAWAIPPLVDSERDGATQEQACGLCRIIDASGSDESKSPHLVSWSDEGDVYDCLFRSEFLIRAGGWVFHGKKRILWLPAAFRPLTPTSFAAHRDKLMILNVSHRIMLVELGSAAVVLE
ncbi:WD40 repeat-like protein [Leucogyrophana mollusca]|uniref:WD40 repeat-like protein n=1 Tax=Leucogyrophana mollusca TaxID=85980 RepID=A0ACB8BP55_9AGAM|nr:WD40 repeat-like protein [Leucogyrophana mollusca]